MVQLVPEVVVEETKGSGFGLVSRVGKERGTLLLKAPPSAWVPYSSSAAMENAKSNPSLMKAVETVVGRKTNFVQSVIMAVNQVVLADQGDAYISFLFEHAGMDEHVLCVPPDHPRLRALRGTTVLREVQLRRTLFNSFGEVLGSEAALRQRFLQSMALITSRGISGLGFPLTLCPVLDFANHASTGKHNNAEFRCNPDDMSFELHAMRNIEAGEEVCINYGQARDASSFMSLYSFHAGSSEHDWVEVGGERVLIDELLRWKKHQASPMHKHIDALSTQDKVTLLRDVEAALEARSGFDVSSPDHENEGWFAGAWDIVHRERQALEECKRSIETLS